MEDTGSHVQHGTRSLLERQDGVVWTGFIWLRIWISGGRFGLRDWLGCMELVEFTDLRGPVAAGRTCRFWPAIRAACAGGVVGSPRGLACRHLPSHHPPPPPTGGMPTLLSRGGGDGG
jgi:hypothetical protein